MPTSMQFGDYLRSAREKTGLSVQSFATGCGVSRSYITLIELNQRLPAKKLISIFARVLQLKPNEIVNWYLEDLREKLKQTH